MGKASETLSKQKHPGCASIIYKFKLDIEKIKYLFIILIPSL